MIAPTKRMDAIGSGIPFEDIYSTVLPKPAIFPGMADMNIADIATLAKKSKKVLIPLFFKVIFSFLIVKNYLKLFILNVTNANPPSNNKLAIE